MSQSSPSRSIEKAKVIFEYDADNPDELTIRVGEIVEIVNKNTDNDGWWEVRLIDRQTVMGPSSNFICPRLSLGMCTFMGMISC